MYKVVCRVVKVNEPNPIEGDETIPKSKCPLYEVGDRITFTTWPTRLIPEECDNVCIFALSAITPATQALCRRHRGRKRLPEQHLLFLLSGCSPAGCLSDRKNSVALGADQASQGYQLLTFMSIMERRWPSR